MQTVILSTLDKKNVPNSSYAPAVKDDDNNQFVQSSLKAMKKDEAKS